MLVVSFKRSQSGSVFERRPTDAPDWPGWQLRDGTEAPEGTCRCAGRAVAGSPFTLFGIDRTGTVDTD